MAPDNDEIFVEGIGWTIVYYMVCKCYVWPIVLNGMRIGPCGRCEASPSGSHDSYEEALEEFIHLFVRQPEPIE